MSPSHIPRKRFGQHFLADPHYIDAIVDAIHPQPGDILVEIGPGLGALTQPLLARLPHLHVVEIDRDIIARLQREIPADRITIHAGDALRFDFGQIAPRFRVCGNLPYNISSPLLFHLANWAGQTIDLHFMLQKEVVDRMVAPPSSPDYGRLSVMLQYRYWMDKCFTVPPGAFNPPPKVDSAVVRMIPHASLPFPASDEKHFGRVVTAAFAQRRKTLRNTLRDFISGEAIAGLGIDPGLRAENLGVEAFVTLANATQTP
jgi:16S rRNA (adenine1518-N6/adenine1519-N6)-dimethyltransferase